MSFVHLHVHTEYSLLDGASRIKNLIKKASSLNMKGIAITDHGVMYGIVEFYKEAKKAGIKPIIGCEVYVAGNSRFDRISDRESDRGHLILLAKNNIGYKNLMKIVSTGFIEGFYYKPRVDMEILEKYSEGIIATSACLAGHVAQAIMERNIEKAKKIAIEHQRIFGKGNYYLEVQHNNIEEQNLVNKELITLSKELSIPLVATNDVHYVEKEDSKPHDVLLCIQTGTNVDEENRMRFSTDEFYLKSYEEMLSPFKNIPEALENTVKIMEMCNVELDFNAMYLPEFKVPDGKDSFEYLKELCYKGLEIKGLKDTQRLEYELNVIRDMGYIDYFLITWDFIRYAKEKSIMVGPGRGSAAGSLVSYTLGITNINPIKYNLIFERFLNPERITMPDIDIDFCYERRQEVIDYVVDKYGSDRVAQIITFGTMAARAAIRDVGRALNIPYGDVDLVAKMIPFQIGVTIEKALQLNPELKKRYDNDPKIEELIDTAIQLEGMPRHASTHAAGVVITKEPVTEYVPLQKNDECVTTQYPMGTLEELGLLKMDFLGLRTLTVIRDTIDMVKENYNIEINIEDIEFDDENVYKMISKGITSGVFQLESSGMTQFMKDLKPLNLEDIIAGISLYRPGPMDSIPKYLKNKNYPENVHYAHPKLEEILSVTYGCMVYQEQVMQIVRDIGGYSLGRADLVRRAMSKKKMDVMKLERKHFIEGALKDNVSKEVANGLFDEMIDFASYAFNKSHAAAYAVIAYQTGWLKYYYPIEFMAAILNSFLSSSDKVSGYVDNCKQMKIEVLPPDINESMVKFSVVNKKIRFGLCAIKNVGVGVIKEVINDRKKNGLFIDFLDFCQRTVSLDINKRCVESLIKAGTFDSFGVFRSQLIASFEKIIESISINKKRNIEGQLSLFDMDYNINENSNFDFKFHIIKEFPKKMLLAMEKEMLGLYISGHPLDVFKNEINKKITATSLDLMRTGEQNEDSNIEKLRDGKIVVVGGIITNKKTMTTKNNKIMAFLELEDYLGTMEIVVFPNVYARFAAMLVEDNMIFVKGSINLKEEEQAKVICENIELIKKELNKTLHINMINEKNNKFESLKALLEYFSGNSKCIITMEKDNRKFKNDSYYVDLNDILLKELHNKFGKENIKLFDNNNKMIDN